MQFHITSDFPDDVSWAQGEWDEAALRSAIRGLPERGIRAVHWLDYPAAEGLWDPGSGFDGPDGRGSRMISRIPDPLAVVSDEAHRAGMKAYAVLKPFDLAYRGGRMVYAVGKEPVPPVGLPDIAGSGATCARWIREHREARMRLHPSLDARADEAGAIRAIRFWHEGPEVPALEITGLWVSSDNATYEPYRGPMEVTRERRRRRPPVYRPAPEREFGPEGGFGCVEISGLEIVEPFVGFEFAGDLDLANTLFALVEALDAWGRAVPFTYGLVPAGRGKPDLRKAGFAFDDHRCLKIEEGCTGSYSRLRNRVTLRGLPCVGLARGRNTYLTAPVEFAYPEVREWLAGVMRREVEAGADGVDIRISSHTMSLDYENYGFNPPLVDAFRERHGVDVTREPFDRAAWRRLRGEYADAFIEEASRAVRGAGGVLFAHVTESFGDSPEGPCYHETFWDWRRWVEEGRLDAVTAKQTAFDSPLTEELKRARVPVILNKKPGGAGNDDEDLWLEYLERAREGGFETFNIYELALFARLTKDGSLTCRFPRFWKRVKELAS
jgi:hypothetical protein